MLSINSVWRTGLIAIVATATLVACTAPAGLLDRQAQELGFERRVVPGKKYSHVVYRNRIPGRRLHVYLDGDGTPWLRRFTIAADPTPRKPLVLQWMAQDNMPSIYLGRPCYHGRAQDPGCHPLLWTARRYGPEVVESMAAALLTTAATDMATDEIVLIGYSGGGALAMLLAGRIPATRAVVTVAGNLEPSAWAAWHGYAPLTGSLEPTAPLPSSILQLHFAGRQDRNLPVALIQAAVARQDNAELIVLAAFDHVCCWREYWPRALAQLQTKLDARR